MGEAFVELGAVLEIPVGCVLMFIGYGSLMEVFAAATVWVPFSWRGRLEVLFDRRGTLSSVFLSLVTLVYVLDLPRSF